MDDSFLCRNFHIFFEDAGSQLFFTGLILKLPTFFRFSLRLSSDVRKGLFVVSIEALMMKVTLLPVFTYFVEVVHVKLTRAGGTCLMNEE